MRERMPLDETDMYEIFHPGMQLTESQLEDLSRAEEIKREVDQWVVNHPNKKNVVEIKKAFNEDISNPLDLVV